MFCLCLTFCIIVLYCWTELTLHFHINIHLPMMPCTAGYKWMEVKTSILRHALETSGSLQALCQSCTSRQLHSLCVWDRGAESCGVEEIDPPCEVLSLPLHDMKFQHKGRGHPAGVGPTPVSIRNMCVYYGTMHTISKLILECTWTSWVLKFLYFFFLSKAVLNIAYNFCIFLTLMSVAIPLDWRCVCTFV